MNPEEKFKAAQKKAADLLAKADAEGRPLTAEEADMASKALDEADALKVHLKAADRAKSIMGDLFSAPADASSLDEPAPAGEPKMSIGEHFVKHTDAKMRAVKGATVGAPEYKAATDSHVVGSVFGPWLTEYDRTIVRAPRLRLTIEDLLGSGTLSGNSIAYLIEAAAVEGAFTTVAEGGAKPQLHVPDPTMATDSLRKIAGWTKFSDEMLEDEAFLKSEIDNRLIYEFMKVREAQILSGNGVGQNLLGILNRSGIQTELRGNLASNDTAADAIFRGITKVATGSGLSADGIVINPLDYQTLRLARDANLQYYGGGFFSGQYGQGGILEQPPLWGLRTVVTPAVAVGQALVGAFAQLGTVYSKGGLRVESTNSHASDFTSNLVTMRIEQRLALAVRVPAGLVKVTLTVAP